MIFLRKRTHDCRVCLYVFLLWMHMSLRGVSCSKTAEKRKDEKTRSSSVLSRMRRAEGPFTIRFYQNFAPENLVGTEGSPFDPFVIIEVIGENGKSVLDSTADLWSATATLTLGTGSHPRAVLTGDTTVSFAEGLAVFENLGISAAGNNYQLDFMVQPTADDVLLNPVLSATGLRVSAMEGVLLTVTWPSTLPAPTERTFAQLILKNSEDFHRIEVLQFRGHEWNAHIEQQFQEEYGGKMEPASLEFPMQMNPTATDPIVFTQQGVCMIRVSVSSKPVEFSSEIMVPVHVHSRPPPTSRRTRAHMFTLSFSNDSVHTYSKLATLLNVYDREMGEIAPDFIELNEPVGNGINLTVDGIENATRTLAHQLCNDIENGRSFEAPHGAFKLISPLLLDHKAIGCGEGVGVNYRVTTDKQTSVKISLAIISVLAAVVVLSGLVFSVHRLVKRRRPKVGTSTAQGDRNNPTLWRQNPPPGTATQNSAPLRDRVLMAKWESEVETSDSEDIAGEVINRQRHVEQPVDNPSAPCHRISLVDSIMRQPVDNASSPCHRISLVDSIMHPRSAQTDTDPEEGSRHIEHFPIYKGRKSFPTNDLHMFHK